jgi:hypothetical protein
MTKTAHIALYDTFADSEVGHLPVELHTGRFAGTRFDAITVAESRDPVTTMGGVRVLPDALLADLDPDNSALLVLAGAEMWDAGGGEAFAAVARRFVDASVPVAAIGRRAPRTTPSPGRRYWSCGEQSTNIASFHARVLVSTPVLVRSNRHSAMSYTPEPTVVTPAGQIHGDSCRR